MMMNNASSNKSPMLEHIPIAAVADFGKPFTVGQTFFKSLRNVEIICFRRESVACHILSELSLRAGD
jgi:hypothetical protein